MTIIAVCLMAATVFAYADAQCTGNDDPRCGGWIRNGFCTNGLYNDDYKKKNCGVGCGLCNADGTQTALGGGNNYTPCSDANPNCGTWDSSFQFCTSATYSTAMKLLYCCGTCRSKAQATTTTTAASSTTATTTTSTTTTTEDPKNGRR